MLFMFSCFICCCFCFYRWAPTQQCQTVPHHPHLHSRGMRTYSPTAHGTVHILLQSDHLCFYRTSMLMPFFMMTTWTSESVSIEWWVHSFVSDTQWGYKKLQNAISSACFLLCMIRVHHGHLHASGTRTLTSQDFVRRCAINIEICAGGDLWFALPLWTGTLQSNVNVLNHHGNVR